MIDMVRVAIQRIKPDLVLPSYETSGAVGLDLKASEACVLIAGGTALVPTGLSVAIPKGYEAQIRSRSGLALNHGIVVLNAPGTIDQDYRGEIKVILMNLSNTPFEIKVGDRIAQMVFAPIAKVDWQEVITLDATERNTGGFGSTGI